MHFSVDKNGYMFMHAYGIKGFLNKSDVDELIKHAKQLPSDALYAETGTFMGASALLCSFNSDAKIWCHDIWTLDSDINEVGYPSENFFKVYEKVFDYNLESRVFLVPGDSLKTYKIHRDDSLDLVFIDGDHSYDGALGDFENFLSKVKKNGGVILAHDCTPNSDCKKALVDFCDKHTLTYEILPGTTGMAKICL